MSKLNSLNKTKENVMVESPFLDQKEGQSRTKMGHG